MRHLALVLVLCLPACGPSTPTIPVPPRPDVFSVSWQALTRDYTTANAYKGHRVRMVILHTDYDVQGSELHVWANARDVPPILVCHCDSITVAPKSPVVVVGTCRGATRDGIHRKPGGDFRVTVEGCVVTTR